MKSFLLMLRELFKRRLAWILLVLFLLFVLNGVLLICNSGLPQFVSNKWTALVIQTLFVWLAVLACHSLTNIFSLKRNESGITWCQISILFLFGLWIIGFVIIFDVNKLQRFALPIGIIGSVISLIFQDTLKGVSAFIHLRLNNQISIGDWIIIPKHNVDGEVSRITLTHVTFYNWDTTTSTIPTSVLHSEHFQNLTNMMDGRTFGRKMSKTFILDTGWIHIITEQEANELKQSDAIIKYLAKDDIKSGMTNAQLYRLYLYHWLMNHPHISQQPRLIVRWMEQKESGMPLQVYAFITDSNLPGFEWQQSQIIEHIMESLEWFGLRLYQSPSNYDVSNSNVFLTNKPATYRKEE